VADHPLPPLLLLDEPKPQIMGYSEETLSALACKIELKLKDFHIDAQIVGVHPGPVITRFEMQPALGIEGSQISSLDKKLARGLSVASVRVVDVIPGNSAFGLEIPNARREIVYLFEILSSGKYDALRSPLALALGKDIGGGPVVVDLQKMPHLLVAGTTGSGKSVALNAMVLSLLYKASARDVRMIMIDPKTLELSFYQGIPHLLAPIVTDLKEAANALRWCVSEMERRYKLMSMVGVRNFDGLNKKVKDAHDHGQPILDPLFRPEALQPNVTAQPLHALPHIVVIIDEFADIMVAGESVEDLMLRILLDAHKAGIHLIAATARPDHKTLPSKLEPYFKARLVFRLPESKAFARVTDLLACENLLEWGDAFFLQQAHENLPIRVHVASVSEAEALRTAEFLRTASEEKKFVIPIETRLPGHAHLVDGSGLPADPSSDEKDELYDQAVRIVTESRRASISGVQRLLKIGYNRAARLIEVMEQEGIVTPPETNGNRTVLAPPPKD